MSQPTPAPNRPAQTPTANAATGTASGVISNAITAAVIQANPELGMFSAAFGAVAQGLLSGIGNAARTAKARGNWLGTLFAWL